MKTGQFNSYAKRQDDRTAAYFYERGVKEEFKPGDENTLNYDRAIRRLIRGEVDFMEAEDAYPDIYDADNLIYMTTRAVRYCRGITAQLKSVWIQTVSLSKKLASV